MCACDGARQERAKSKRGGRGAWRESESERERRCSINGSKEVHSSRSVARGEIDVLLPVGHLSESHQSSLAAAAGAPLLAQRYTNSNGRSLAVGRPRRRDGIWAAGECALQGFRIPSLMPPMQSGLNGMNKNVFYITRIVVVTVKNVGPTRATDGLPSRVPANKRVVRHYCDSA